MENSKGPNTDASAKIAAEVDRVKTVMDQGKAYIATRKNDFDLHVLLIMKKTGISKALAIVAAWDEGPHGLEIRLAKK